VSGMYVCMYVCSILRKILVTQEIRCKCKRGGICPVVVREAFEACGNLPTGSMTKNGVQQTKNRDMRVTMVRVARRCRLWIPLLIGEGKHYYMHIVHALYPEG
jgi:hypothetical protein